MAPAIPQPSLNGLVFVESFVISCLDQLRIGIFGRFFPAERRRVAFEEDSWNVFDTGEVGRILYLGIQA